MPSADVVPICGAPRKAKEELPKISRKDAIAQKRATFAKGLFNQDLKMLAEWHRYRSPAEQKRFLKSVDCLYTTWCKKGEKFEEGEGARLADIPEDEIISPLPRSAPEHRAAPDAVRVAEAAKMMDLDVSAGIALTAGLGGGGVRGGIVRSGHTLPSLGSSSHRSHGSSSSHRRSLGGSSHRSHGTGMAQVGLSDRPPGQELHPIHVHNNRMRRKIHAPDSLTLDGWLDAESEASTRSVCTDVSDYSHWTGISDMTATTEGSLESAPCPVMKTQFKHHVRGYAINRRKWRTKHNQDGLPIPHQSYPAERRFKTSTGTQFPNPFGEKTNPLHKDPKMYESIFCPGSHSFVEGALANLGEADVEKFLYMVRCLHQVRLESKPRTSTARDLDIVENQRLYQPTRASPFLDPTDLRKSSVPLGCLNESLHKYQQQLGHPHLITPEESAAELTAKDVQILSLENLTAAVGTGGGKPGGVRRSVGAGDGASDVFGIGPPSCAGDHSP